MTKPWDGASFRQSQSSAGTNAETYANELAGRLRTSFSKATSDFRDQELGKAAACWCFDKSSRTETLEELIPFVESLMAQESTGYGVASQAQFNIGYQSHLRGVMAHLKKQKTATTAPISGQK